MLYDKKKKCILIKNKGQHCGNTYFKKKNKNNLNEQILKFADFFLKVYLFILRERDKQRQRDQTGGGTEREGERESQAVFVLLEWSLMWGSIP